MCNYCPSTSIALVFHSCWGVTAQKKEGSGREERGDAKDCITYSDSAVTFQLPLKFHLRKGQLSEKSQIVKDQRAVSKHLHFLRKAGMKTCPPCTCLLYLNLLHILWAPLL